MKGSQLLPDPRPAEIGAVKRSAVRSRSAGGSPGTSRRGTVSRCGAGPSASDRLVTFAKNVGGDWTRRLGSAGARRRTCACAGSAQRRPEHSGEGRRQMYVYVRGGRERGLRSHIFVRVGDVNRGICA